MCSFAVVVDFEVPVYGAWAGAGTGLASQSEHEC